MKPKAAASRHIQAVNNKSSAHGANRLNTSALDKGDEILDAMKKNGGQKILRTRNGVMQNRVLIPRGTTL